MCDSRTVDYEALDPGIREVVRTLRKWGFNTCDSGDGKTKVGDPEWDQETVNPVPHVAVVVPADELVEQARHLASLLKREGVALVPQGRGGPYVAASFDPTDGTAILYLAELDDDGLLAARRSDLDDFPPEYEP
ncbi:MAG TPA: hypothetical protein VEB59_12800 [Gemmatimonadales bacterium]|nr:hypothetical protein [Gemmatimonadales bacterium]